MSKTMKTEKHMTVDEFLDWQMKLKLMIPDFLPSLVMLISIKLSMPFFVFMELAKTHIIEFIKVEKNLKSIESIEYIGSYSYKNEKSKLGFFSYRGRTWTGSNIMHFINLETYGENFLPRLEDFYSALQKYFCNQNIHFEYETLMYLVATEYGAVHLAKSDQSIQIPVSTFIQLRENNQ